MHVRGLILSEISNAFEHFTLTRVYLWYLIVSIPDLCTITYFSNLIPGSAHVSIQSTCSCHL